MKKKPIFSLFLLGIFLLAWCDSLTPQEWITFELQPFSFQYLWDKVWRDSQQGFSTDGVLAVFEESNEETSTNLYKDSFIIAQQYNLGKWTLSFARDSLSYLKQQGLSLEEEKEDKWILNCPDQQRDVVLISYYITEGFITKVPKLYITQAFLENEHTIYVISHSSEEKSSQKDMIESFKTISCL